MSGVIAVEKSGNKKIGPSSATYVAQSSCPTTCPLLGAGCYAESGRMALHTRRLAESSASVDELAREEADAIDTLSGRLPLRIHVVGDSTTSSAARRVAASVRRYVKRHGSSAWGYTHAWRDVPASAWRGVSMLASCESRADVDAAHARGYRAAIVVDEHRSDKRHDRDGVDVIPCPEQTRGARCIDCRLCWDPPAGAVIAFAAHGARAKTVRATVA
jgi:hypothetical protein